jgi:beta-lactamase regulating signal transducer with metallopeptidase domain
MNSPDFSDPVFCGQVCLTLFHSLWQMGLLAAAGWAVERWRRRAPAQGRYLLHVVLLVAGVVAVPLTYAIVDASDARPSAVLAKMPVAAETPVAADAPVARERHEARSPSASSRAPTPAARRALFWPRAAPWIFVAYLAGVVLMVLRLFAALFRAHRLASLARPLTDGPLVSAIQTLARRWSMHFAPLLAQTEEVVVPRVVGLLRPVILLPASAVSGLTSDELELILAHELAHVRRHDMWIVVVQRLAEAALFYNPGLWYLSRRISTQREYCCDDLACGAQQRLDGPLRYSAALVRLIETAVPRHAGPANPLSLAADGRSPSELRRRVARLLGEPLREPVRLTRGAACTIATLSLLLAFLPMTAPGKAPPDGNETAAEPEDKEPAVGSKDRFSFGGKVEVLALGLHDQNEDCWWDAEGKPLKSLPAPLVGCLVRQTDEQGEPLASLPITWKTGGGRVVAENVVWWRIIFRIRDLPDDTDVTWSMAKSHAYGSSEVGVEGEANPKGYFSRYFGVPPQQKTTTLKVGVAIGKWKTEAEVQPFGMTAIGAMGRGIVFSEEFDTQKGASIIVSHDYLDQNVRVVAVDKQGQLQRSTAGGGAGAGKVWLERHDFPKLKRDDIDHFEFQTRAYEYVETPVLPLERPADP